MRHDRHPPGNISGAEYERQCEALGERVGADPNVREISGLRYGDHAQQCLDLYLPTQVTAPVPVWLFLHGGGFTSGSRGWARFMAPWLCRNGIALASADYRLMPEVAWPDPFHDAVSALAWLHREGGEYGIDPARLCIGGHSAGGSLAAVAALREDWLAAAGVPAAALRGVLCLSTSFNRFAVTGTPGSDYILPAGPLPVDPHNPLLLAPRAPVSRPYLIVWGGCERQLARIERSAMAMIGALRDRGVVVDWLFDPQRDHFETHLALACASTTIGLTALSWLQRTFGQTQDSP